MTLELFAEDCYWRDIVAFTWNVKTMEGNSAIAAMLEATLGGTSPPGGWMHQRLGRAGGAARGIGSASRRPARRARAGHLHARSRQKCRTILTTPQARSTGMKRRSASPCPMGVRHGADRNRETWVGSVGARGSRWRSAPAPDSAYRIA